MTGYKFWLRTVIQAAGAGAYTGPKIEEKIQSMGALFADDADLYEGLDGHLDKTWLWVKTQRNVVQYQYVVRTA